SGRQLKGETGDLNKIPGTITGSVRSSGPATGTAAFLTSLADKVTGKVNATATMTFVGSVAEVRALGDKTNLGTASSYNANFDAAPASAVDILAVDADNNSGTLDGTLIPSISGNTTDVLAAYDVLDSKPTAWTAILTGDAILSELLTLVAVTDDDVN